MKHALRYSLWPGLAPGESTAETGHDIDEGKGPIIRLGGITGPEIFVYPHSDPAPRPCVIVCPGGGYQILAADLEGSEVATWLNGIGYAAAVLHYRCPDNRDGAFQDGQRAISWIRAHASEFGIDTECVGVLGFSAGGHLVTRLAIANGIRSYPAEDEADGYSCRPDFSLPIYPAFLIEKETGAVQPEVQPFVGMPPMLLEQSRDDAHFCVEAYAQHAAAIGAPVEGRVYSTGGHGYGVRLAPDIPASQWTADAESWLHSVTAKK